MGLAGGGVAAGKDDLGEGGLGRRTWQQGEGGFTPTGMSFFLSIIIITTLEMVPFPLSERRTQLIVQSYLTYTQDITSSFLIFTNPGVGMGNLA
jgi:hypothetical protein